MNASKIHTVTEVLILEDQQDLSLDELCRACSTEIDELLALVDEGVIAPRGAEPALWRFTGLQLRRARVAVRLQRDLGVNTAGAALALQLMDELDDLRARLRAAGLSA
ncbi:MerR family transcriptional regulator [Comamonadaceae bacterium G21597-S1]|nr:MerR family transcriptional regulator [Comamonadaceae bacterium G21597-S1]